MPSGGHNRVPTALKVLRGNPGKRPLPANEPKPAVQVPEMPSGLSPAARAEWQRVVPELVELGVIARIDRAALSGYCEAWATWLQANREMQKKGAELVQATSGGPAASALLRIRTAAAKEMADFAREFGMTPAARSRVQAPPPKDSANAREATVASLVR